MLGASNRTPLCDCGRCCRRSVMSPVTRPFCRWSPLPRRHYIAPEKQFTGLFSLRQITAVRLYLVFADSGRVQRCQRKEKYHPVGWIAVRKTVAYRCVSVGRTCDTLSEEKTPIRKKLVARVSRRERVYKRTGESQRDFLRKGGVAE